MKSFEKSRNFNIQKKIMVKLRSKFDVLPIFIKKLTLIYWKIINLLFFGKIKIDSKIDKSLVSFVTKDLRNDGISIFKSNEFPDRNVQDLISNISIEGDLRIKNINVDIDEESRSISNQIAGDKSLKKPFRYNLHGEIGFNYNDVTVDFKDPLIANLVKLGLNNNFLAIAQDYLGCKPYLGRFYYWYDYKINQKEEISTQLFHQDGDDIKFFKIFVYLNDVDEKNGAHSYIPRTQEFSSNPLHINIEKKETKFNSFKGFSEEDIHKAYPEDVYINLIGNKGHIIFEDTSGYHRGKMIENGSRKMLVFEYFSPFSRFAPEYNIKNADDSINSLNLEVMGVYN